MKGAATDMALFWSGWQVETELWELHWLSFTAEKSSIRRQTKPRPQLDFDFTIFLKMIINELLIFHQLYSIKIFIFIFISFFAFSRSVSCT